MKFFNTFSLLFCLFSASLFAQPEPTSILTEDYQVSTSSYFATKKTIFILNANGKKIEGQNFSWQLNTWDLVGKDIYAYNAGGKLTEVTSTSISAGVSTLQSRSRYEYDANANLIDFYIESYNGTQWVITTHVKFERNAASKLTLQLNEQFNNGMLEYATRQTFTYDAQGRYDKTYDEVWLGTAWLFTQRSSYTYANQTTEDFTATISNSYNPNNGAWGTATRRIKGTITLVSGNKNRVEITENLGGGGWVKSYRQTLTIKGTDGPEILTLQDTWPPTGGTAWVPQLEIVTTLNADNSPNIRTTSDIYNPSQTFKPKNRLTFVYGTVSENSVLNNLSIKIFPNPTQDQAIIDLGDLSANLDLLDQNGRILSTSVAVTGQTAIEMSSLPAGQYFVKVSAKGSPIAIRAVVKQ